MASPLQIRPYEPADWPAVWALLEPVFRAGETFPHDPAISESEAQVAWVEHSQAVMVATDLAGAVVGTYYLKPNSLALGAHMANAGYVVAEHCRRQPGAGLSEIDPSEFEEIDQSDSPSPISISNRQWSIRGPVVGPVLSHSSTSSCGTCAAAAINAAID